MRLPNPNAAAPAAIPTVGLNPKASKLAARGRPWFYADDLNWVEAEHGDIVRVHSARRANLGLGFYSVNSKLRLRLCGAWEGWEVPDPGLFFQQRLAGALQRRRELMGDGDRLGLRLVHGDSDLLPGLVVDRYARSLVLQTSAATVEQNLSSIVPNLVELTGAESVLARNDIAARDLEGLPREVRLLHGRRILKTEIEEAGILHEVMLWEGQKTGFYLDQRPARARVRQLARGRRVLDLFCYQGGFTLSALAGGAMAVQAVDQSEPALSRLVAAAGRQGLGPVEAIRANVFDHLRQLRQLRRDKVKATYDLVVLDPPAFARSRAERPAALRAYRDLNRLALRLLAPGGLLLTCSCSHHVDPTAFERMVRQAAAELSFPVIMRERIPAGADHPVWLSLPESEYLKVVLLERPGATEVAK